MSSNSYCGDPSGHPQHFFCFPVGQGAIHDGVRLVAQLRSTRRRRQRPRAAAGDETSDRLSGDRGSNADPERCTSVHERRAGEGSTPRLQLRTEALDVS